MLFFPCVSCASVAIWGALGITRARSLSDLGLIYCAGGRAAHSSPIFRYIAPLCASKSANSVLAPPPCSLQSPKSDRLLG
jgi:hypothetical protein